MELILVPVDADVKSHRDVSCRYVGIQEARVSASVGSADASK
jgi:hypothetical protein